MYRVFTPTVFLHRVMKPGLRLHFIPYCKCAIPYVRFSSVSDYLLSLRTCIACIWPCLGLFVRQSKHLVPCHKLALLDFPHLIVEVISNRAQSDCRRMLLQAACPARLDNAFRLGSALKQESADPFIVSAIYISNLDMK